jgi:uncharacterized cupredoxin-like copper-binding protein
LLVNGIRSVVGCVILALALPTFAACSSDSGTTVTVSAADFSLKPDVSSVEAGTVKFKVKNNGAFTHEMVVVKVADASDLPTKPDGEVDEDKIPKAEQLGEVEDVLPGKTETLKLDLEAGKYVLFCNRNDGTKAVHFKEGMHADFTVTAAK